MSLLAKNRSAANGSPLRAALADAHALAQATNAPIVLSYAIRAPELNLASLFTNTVDTERFLFEKPSLRVGLLGLGAAIQIEANGENRFAAIREQAAAALQNMLLRSETECSAKAASQPTPKFVGGFAFESVSHRSQLWNAFPPARFLLPEVQIEKHGATTWLLLQTRVKTESDLEELALRLEERQTQILKWTIAAPAQNKAILTDAAQSSATRTRTTTENAAIEHAHSFVPFDLLRHDACAVDPFHEIPLARTQREPSPAVREHYLAIVRKALAAIDGGKLEKVVVARSTTLFCREGLDPARMLKKLRATYPQCTLFAVASGADTFLGATPECLVALEDDHLHIDALAGSAPRGATPEADAANRGKLESSLKERREHALVVQSIRDAVAARCDSLQIPDSPRVLALDAIQHLHSPITGRAARSHTVLDFVEALHPTAALAGTPRKQAMHWLAQNEALERGWYGGPVGWFDANGSGDFSVALRCALLKPTQALFFAGAGIVAGSDPEQELEETRLKLRASLLAFLEIET